MSTTNPTRASAVSTPPGSNGYSHQAKSYWLHVLITQEEKSLFSAVALNLPGVGSQGETVEQAIENTKDAFRAVKASYDEDGEEIPWQDVAQDSVLSGSIVKKVYVNG